MIKINHHQPLNKMFFDNFTVGAACTLQSKLVNFLSNINKLCAKGE